MITTKHPPLPPSDDCKNRIRSTWHGLPTLACFYPQMGGYHGKCVVVPAGDCFDVYIWHDGDFPFGDSEPAVLHHCNPEQFVDFGNAIDAFLEAAKDD